MNMDDTILSAVTKAMQEKNAERFEEIYHEELNKVLLMVVQTHDQKLYGSLLGVLLLRDHLEDMRHPQKD